MQRIEFDKKVDGKKQAAFVILYALDGRPWLNYPGLSSERTSLVVPTCLMLNRSDGRIGFIGGGVNPEETLKQAALREVSEEIGYKIVLPIKPVVAHDIGEITTHAFAARLSYEDLREIQKNATSAEHFGSEVTGIFLPHLDDYQSRFGDGRGITELIKGSMATSVREELMHFLLDVNIFSKEELKDICQRSGFSLEDLLR